MSLPQLAATTPLQPFGTRFFIIATTLAFLPALQCLRSHLVTLLDMACRASSWVSTSTSKSQRTLQRPMRALLAAKDETAYIATRCERGDSLQKHRVSTSSSTAAAAAASARQTIAVHSQKRSRWQHQPQQQHSATSSTDRESQNSGHAKEDLVSVHSLASALLCIAHHCRSTL